MTKRIIAAALAAVLIFCFVTEQTAHAGALTGIFTLGGLAWQLLNMMTGKMDGTADALGYMFENAVTSISDVDEWVIVQLGQEKLEQYFDGWDIICNTVDGWINNNEVSVSGTALTMSYSQYLELCELVGVEIGELNMDFGVDIPYQVFPFELDTYFNLARAPKTQGFYGDAGTTYIPVYYNDDDIYFNTNQCIFWGSLKNADYKIYRIGFWLYSLTDNYGIRNINNGGVEFKPYSSVDGAISANPIGFKLNSGYYPCLSFGVDSNGQFIQYNGLNDYYSTRWLHFDSSGSGLVSCYAENIDTANFTYGYLAVDGYGSDFLQAINQYSITTGVPVDDLSDVLDPILEVDSDPTLTIETDPTIATDPSKAVTVNDIPLSDLYEEVDTDIDIPSVIIDKFPFCIPFDFIRIIGVLCTEPKPPIFVIPISTDPSQLEPFKGNQTIGELPEDFTPMFEIDEEIVIDLTGIPLVQPICYTIFIIGFVVLLIYLTPKMINH